MFKKLAKIKYLPNNFEIIEEWRSCYLCYIWKKNSIRKLTYWNVDLQEPYFSYVEASLKRENKIKLFPPIMCPNPLIRIFNNHFF